MKIDDLKQKATAAAMKVVQSETARNVLADARFQKAVGKAFELSAKVRHDVAQARKSLAHRFDLATEDDLRELKEKLDKLDSNRS